MSQDTSSHHHPLYYVICTASSRTEHIKGGDIVLAIKGAGDDSRFQQLYTSPDIKTSSFKNADDFFESFVVPRIVASEGSRTCRVIRFFRKIYRGRYVAPRDAKLNHVEATFIFDKRNLEPMAAFHVGVDEPDHEDEDAFIRRARESGELPSVVFDVVFPDAESMGLNLWSNFLAWQSSLGAIDSTPVITNVSRRVLPSEMAGTAPAPPPFMRAAAIAASASATTPSKPRMPSSTDMAHAYNMLQLSPAAPVVRPALVDNSTMFTNFVDPLLARREKDAADKDRDQQRFPKPSETAGTAPSLPPFMRRTSSDTPPPTMKRLQPPPAQPALPVPAAASVLSPSGPSPHASPSLSKADVVPSPQQQQQPQQQPQQPPPTGIDDFGDDDGMSFGGVSPSPLPLPLSSSSRAAAQDVVPGDSEGTAADDATRATQVSSSHVAAAAPAAIPAPAPAPATDADADAAVPSHMLKAPPLSSPASAPASWSERGGPSQPATPEVPQRNYVDIDPLEASAAKVYASPSATAAAAAAAKRAQTVVRVTEAPRRWPHLLVLPLLVAALAWVIHHSHVTWSPADVRAPAATAAAASVAAAWGGLKERICGTPIAAAPTRSKLDIFGMFRKEPPPDPVHKPWYQLLC